MWVAMSADILFIPTSPVGEKLIFLFRDTPIVSFSLGNPDIIWYRVITFWSARVHSLKYFSYSHLLNALVTFFGKYIESFSSFRLRTVMMSMSLALCLNIIMIVIKNARIVRINRPSGTGSRYVLPITAVPTLETSKYTSKVRLNLIQQNMLCSTTKNVKKEKIKKNELKFFLSKKKSLFLWILEHFKKVGHVFEIFCLIKSIECNQKLVANSKRIK